VRDHGANAEKIDQEQAPSSEKMTLYDDGGERLQRATEQLRRGETLKNWGQKLVGDCCSGEKVDVVVQVGWEETGMDTNFVVLEGPLERDVSGRARVEDRDCCLRFLGRFLC
jgi:hypothetical protein